MKIPDSITVNTGEQNSEYRKIDEFFKTVVKKEIKLPFNHPHLEKKVMGMWILYNEAKTDEHVHMLLYKERVVALVLETRTDANYVHFDYFFNSKAL